MITTIRKIGNSAGAILPASVREKLNLKEGDSVEIEVKGGAIVLNPCYVRPKYTLGELLAQCDDAAPYPTDIVDWDKSSAVGREVM